VSVVRIAELEIDPAQLESYEAAVKEEMEAAVRLEPGVLAIYAVAEKDHPTRLRFFEIYASEAPTGRISIRRNSRSTRRSRSR
jgi:quinol monooxygenase YgiN